MGDYVRVESVDALQKFRAALCKFAEVVAVGLDEAEAEIQRTGFWVRQDQQDYWKHQAAKRAELYARAKSVLTQKKTQVTALGGRSSCVDEQKALAAAERQLEEARQKQASVRRWSRLLDEESFSYQGLAQGLRALLQTDIPVALAQLDQMIAALEAYTSSPAPEEQRSTAPEAVGPDLRNGPAGQSMARATPAGPAVAPEAYQRLRARTPPRTIRDATRISTGTFAWPHVTEGRPDIKTVLAGCGLVRTPIVADDKMVMARGIGQGPCVYLERAAGVAPGDSGWYIGFADDRDVTGYDGVRVGDLLAQRPDWAAILELPAGCLVVLAGGVLQAVCGPRDALIWPADVGAAR